MVEFNATFLIAMLSFVVFIMIMNAIFYKPVLNIMRKRDEYIKSNYADAKQNSEQAQTLDAERAEKLRETHENCRHNIRDIVDKAQRSAHKKTHEEKEKVKIELQTRKNALTEQSNELENTVKAQVVNDLASSISSKLLGQDLKVNSGKAVE